MAWRPPETLVHITRSGMYEYDSRTLVGIPLTGSCYPDPPGSSRKRPPPAARQESTPETPGEEAIPTPLSDVQLVTDDGDDAG